MDIEAAYKIALQDARSSYEDSELNICTDVGDRYAFSVSYDNYPIIGAPLITVDKKTGEIGYLSLPDKEGFKLLREGTVIDISSVKAQGDS